MIYITLIQGNVYRSIVYRYVNLKARTHRDEFRVRYSPTFNASWLNKGRQCECAHDAKNATRKSIIFFKTPRVRFFGLVRRVKNYSTNEIGAFAHMSGAAEVTVKHNLGALKHKTVLPNKHT